MLEEAYCYELDEMVVAATALSLRKSEEHRALRFFCPEEHCVREVYPKCSRRGTPFYRACEHHKASCPNDQRSERPPPPGGEPEAHPPIEPTIPIPTVLGPLIVRPKQVKSEPSEQELRALICAAKARPAYTPGTLEEVVHAWLQMSPEQRREQDLIINGRQFTYHTAFQIIAAGGDDIAALDWGQRIIFGKVKAIEKGKYAIMVDMLKKFDHDGERRSLFATGPMAQLEPARLAFESQIGDEAISAFMIGDQPKFSENAKKWHFSSTKDLYTGVVIGRD